MNYLINTKTLVVTAMDNREDAVRMGNAFSIVSSEQDIIDKKNFSLVRLAELYTKLTGKSLKKFKSRPQAASRIMNWLTGREDGSPAILPEPVKQATPATATTKRKARAKSRDPLAKAIACREGTRQSATLDALWDLNSPSIDDIVAELLKGDDYPNATTALVRATIGYDICTVKGYGIEVAENGVIKLKLPENLTEPLPHNKRKS